MWLGVDEREEKEGVRCCTVGVCREEKERERCDDLLLPLVPCLHESSPETERGWGGQTSEVEGNAEAWPLLHIAPAS